jgi:hypothetical protein
LGLVANIFYLLLGHSLHTQLREMHSTAGLEDLKEELDKLKALVE